MESVKEQRAIHIALFYEKDGQDDFLYAQSVVNKNCFENMP